MYSASAKSRFNLLHLQEGEEYLKDYQGAFKFVNPNNQINISENGTIHFCSRSIILEAENNTISLFKYLYKDMTNIPHLFERKGQKIMSFEYSRTIEVVTGKTPQPHKRHEMKNKSDSRVEITLSYSSVEKLANLAEKLCEQTKKNLSETEYKQMISDFKKDEQNFDKVIFDKTRIKDITEMPLIGKELNVCQILPLIQIDGLFYLTDKRIYFQPLNTFYAKPLFSYKIKNIKGLYKRRYKLRHVIFR